MVSGCEALAGAALFACLANNPICLPRTLDGRFIVHPDTLASFAHTESGLNVLSVGINESGALAPAFTSLARAAAWVTANAHRSLDVGLTQINTRAGHMQRRGLPVAAALDGCTAMRVGAEVLRDCYQAAPARDEQTRLEQAASCYNTGSHSRGLARERGGNGYATRVQASAEVVVPAIRLRGEVMGHPEMVITPTPRPSSRPAPAETLDLLHPAAPAELPVAPVSTEDPS